MGGTSLDASGAISNGGNRRRPGIPYVARPDGSNLDVRAIRLASKIGATQRTFADAIGVPVKTLRNWEQGRRKPTGPALVLLKLIELNPWVVFDTFHGSRETEHA
ncbi:helix-turn-helix domain-containing protein [Bradyrhizobium sp. DASA03005]|uniref:helix-turn-helix domain-containing protein n=1 Tax=Bradyrhizobium sp. SPXBL-02 TaxID=3395912 RepID=UPI003F6FE268